MMVYNLAIAAVVMFFMVHCGTVADVVNGYRMSSPPAGPAPVLERVARMNAATEWATHGHRMTRIAADSDAVFAEAIGRGVLSEHACDSNFAGYYMYMFHDADGAAWFKHRDTRAYVTMRTCTPQRALQPATDLLNAGPISHENGRKTDFGAGDRDVDRDDRHRSLPVGRTGRYRPALAAHRDCPVGRPGCGNDRAKHSGRKIGPGDR